MDMIWKGIAGGLVTAAIVWLSRRDDTLPGILPLSPAFALIALLIVGAKGDGAGRCAISRSAASTTAWP